MVLAERSKILVLLIEKIAHKRTSPGQAPTMGALVLCLAWSSFLDGERGALGKVCGTSDLRQEPTVISLLASVGKMSIGSIGVSSGCMSNPQMLLQPYLIDLFFNIWPVFGCLGPCGLPQVIQ